MTVEINKAAAQDFRWNLIRPEDIEALLRGSDLALIGAMDSDNVVSHHAL